MFTDGRSRRVVFVAHCLLNQNAISDGTADYPAAHGAAVGLLLKAGVGIVQMPCPELCCLGLDRGNPAGADCPVVEENTRIRRAMEAPPAAARMETLVEQVLWQIGEYHAHGFEILGVVGMNRSPCCGVDTTSDQGREQPGRGVFLEAIRAGLDAAGLDIPLLGIKAGADSLAALRALCGEGAP